MTLTVLDKTTKRLLAQRYINRVLINTEITRHYTADSIPSYTGAVENLENPPGADERNKLIERLEASKTFGLLSYEQGRRIGKVTSRGVVVYASMINVTHINPKLLQHALKQEETHGATDSSTLDPHVWKHVPLIIKYHWARFDPKLRTFIISCMSKNMSTLNKRHLDYSGTLFATPSQHHLPYIPVKFLPSGLKNTESTKTLDLIMDVLFGSIGRIDYDRLIPDPSAAEMLRLRYSVSAPATGPKRGP